MLIFWHCVNILFSITFHLIVLAFSFFFLFFLWSLPESIIILELTQGWFSISIISSHLLALGLWMRFKESEFLFCMQSGINGDFTQGNCKNRERPQAFYKICTKIPEFQHYLLIPEASYGHSYLSLPNSPNQVRLSVEKMKTLALWL